MSTTPTTGPPQEATRPARRGGSRPGTDPQRIARLFEQLPPHAIEAEMCLLGSILLDPQVLGDVNVIVKDARDFYKPTNAAIYETMVQLYDKHAALDIVQLNQRLVDRDILEAVGGQEYLVELASGVPSATNASHYARLVREKAIVRKLIEEAGEILRQAYESREDAASILDRAEHRIFSIAEHYELSEIETLRSLVNEVVAKIQDSDGRGATGVQCGYADLDEKTGGFQPGDFIIIAARPSMGKTSLALNIVENVALRDEPVGIFSLEMSKHQLVERLLASRSGVELDRLRRRMLRSDQYKLLYSACGDLEKAPIYVDDLPGSTLLQIRARSRRLVAKHAVKAIFVDYIQLITVGGRVESRQLEVSEISRGLKGLARELNVPVVAMSQLNRSPEQREGHRPRLSDLRESGSLEQDADVVCLLHREDYYHKGDEDWMERNQARLGLAELIIAKQRNGPTGTVKLSWIEQCTRFKDHSPAVAPLEYADAYDVDETPI